jgi:hypothetical protein
MNAATNTKQVRCVMTQGLGALELSNELIKLLFKTAIDRYVKSKGEEYMTTYQPDGINISIGDGNEKVQTDINCLGLKERIWCMIDDYGDYFVATLLMPNEY